MSERPILMSAPMVRACLDGTKTQTRRVFSAKLCHLMMDAASVGEVSDFLSAGHLEPHDHSYIAQFCPYGAPNGRLWVKETFAETESDGGPVISYRAGGHRVIGSDGSRVPTFTIFEGEVGEIYPPERWTPSIFMPRWASRITLEIVSVRVERLQDISEADAIAEGVPVDDCLHDYQCLWNRINGPDAWALNP